MHRESVPPHWKCICINFLFGVQRRDAFIMFKRHIFFVRNPDFGIFWNSYAM